VAALRRELAQAYETIERLRIVNFFMGHERQETDKVN
jgi:hypothetical protein